MERWKIVASEINKINPSKYKDYIYSIYLGEYVFIKNNITNEIQDLFNVGVEYYTELISKLSSVTRPFVLDKTKPDLSKYKNTIDIDKLEFEMQLVAYDKYLS